jgi:hypothetical protein
MPTHLGYVRGSNDLPPGSRKKYPSLFLACQVSMQGQDVRFAPRDGTAHGIDTPADFLYPRKEYEDTTRFGCGRDDMVNYGCDKLCSQCQYIQTGSEKMKDEIGPGSRCN